MHGADAQLRELAELCHLHVDDAKLPVLLKDVESIIQCTKTIQAMTLNEDIDELYAKGDSHAGAFVMDVVLVVVVDELTLELSNRHRAAA